MPKYVRYGYVTQQVARYKGQILWNTTAAFHLNPKQALENVDNMKKPFEMTDDESGAAQTIEDTTFTQLSGLSAQVLRRVLIKYLDGSTTEITVERWGVEVGKE